MGARVGVGFVGCGRVAHSQFAALEPLPEAELVAVCDIDEERARQMAERWGARLYGCAEELMAADDVDVVFVLTPLPTHFALTREALARGKHVLVEKPVATTRDEVLELAALAERAGVVCMPGHSYRYLPELERLVRLTRQGEVGPPRALFISEIYHMPQELARKYNGPVQEVLTHHLDLAHALLGPPVQVQAFAGCFRGRDIPTGDEQVMINLAFAGGVLGHIFLSWAAEDETSDPWTFKVKLWAADGGLHFSRRDAVSAVRDGRPPWHYPMYDEMFQREVHWLVTRCLRDGAEPLSTMADAAEATRMLEAVKASLARGAVVSL